MIETLIKVSIEQHVLNTDLQNSITEDTISGSAIDIKYKGSNVAPINVQGEDYRTLDVLVYNSVLENGTIRSSVVQINDPVVTFSDVEVVHTFNPSQMFKTSETELTTDISNGYGKFTFENVATNFTRGTFGLTLNIKDVPSMPDTWVNVIDNSNRILRDGWYSIYSILAEPWNEFMTFQGKLTYSSQMYPDGLTVDNLAGVGEYLVDSDINYKKVLQPTDDYASWVRKDFFWFPDLTRVYKTLLQQYSEADDFAKTFYMLKVKSDAIQHLLRAGKYADAQYIIQTTRNLQLKFKSF